MQKNKIHIPTIQRRNLIFSLSLLIFLIIANLHNCIADEKASFNTISNDLAKSAADARFIGSELGRLDAGDLAISGLVIGATATAYVFDQDMRNFMQKHQNHSADNVFLVARQGGEITYMAGLSGAVYLTGLFAESDRTRKVGREMLEALALSGVTTVLLKYAAGRSRPFTNNGKSDFRFFQTEDQFTSFSSGHTAVAFSLASVLSGEFDNNWISVALYSIATMTGLSRIYNDKHWLSDVVMGASIGIISGRVIARANRTGNDQKGMTNTLIIPSGFAFCYHF